MTDLTALFDFCKRRLGHRLGKTVARFLKARDGATVVEFGLIAVPFFLIVTATVQTAIVFMAQQQLETVTEEASRLVLTNQVGGMSASDFGQKVCTVPGATVMFACSKFMVNVQNYGGGTSFSGASTSAPTITFDKNGNVTNSWTFNPGGVGSIVVVQIMYQWPIFLKPFGYNLSNLSNGNRLLLATAVFRNEP
jgi:Flp pilus assembly protein TadG